MAVSCRNLVSLVRRSNPAFSLQGARGGSSTSLADSAELLRKSLRAALRGRDASKACNAFEALQEKGEPPDGRALRKLLALLVSSKERGRRESLERACNVLLRVEGGVVALHGDLVGRLATSLAEVESFGPACDALRKLLHANLPLPAAALTDVLGRLCQDPYGAPLATDLFLDLCRSPLAMKLLEKDTFDSVLKACALVGDAEKADAIFQQMQLCQATPDNGTFSSLIRAYQRGGHLQKMGKIPVWMKKASVAPDRSTLHALMSACVNAGEVDIAAQLVLQWVHRLSNHNGHGEKNMPWNPAATPLVQPWIGEWGVELVSPNVETYLIVLTAYLDRSSMDKAAEFLINLDTLERPSDLGSSSSSRSIEKLIKQGLIEATKLVMEEMAQRNAPATSASYALLVKAYASLPHPRKAVEVLRNAAEVGHQLDDASCYEALLEAHLLLQEYEDAYMLFRDMKRRGVAPLEPSFHHLVRVLREKERTLLVQKVLQVASRYPRLPAVELKHWNEVVQDLCAVMKVVPANAAIRRMKECGFEPDAWTYELLLNGYIATGKRKVNEMMLLWSNILKRAATASDGKRECARPMLLSKTLLCQFLFVFIRFGFFDHAMEVVHLLEAQDFSINKNKYWNICLKYQRSLFKGNAAKTEANTPLVRKQMEHAQAFKTWLALENEWHSWTED